MLNIIRIARSSLVALGLIVISSLGATVFALGTGATVIGESVELAEVGRLFSQADESFPENASELPRWVAATQVTMSVSSPQPLARSIGLAELA